LRSSGFSNTFYLLRVLGVLHQGQSHCALWVQLLGVLLQSNFHSAVSWKGDCLCPTWPAMPLPVVTPAALCVDQRPTWCQFCVCELGFFNLTSLKTDEQALDVRSSLNTCSRSGHVHQEQAVTSATLGK
jgi:hypothetical protein